MKQLFRISVILIASTAFLACNEGKEKKTEELSSEDIALYMAKGDSISSHAQKTLMANVASAIKEGGTDYAVDFCNTAAMPLTDSIASMHQSKIERLTDKNRNPNNTLSAEIDIEVWEKMMAAFQSNEATKDYVEQEDGEVYFYRPIHIAMETCLKCHGGNDDISESTRKIIAEKYPNDKALGYEMGDLRGMWKVKLNQE